MPELPEVEVVRRHLREAVEGATVVSAEVRGHRTARRHATPADLVDRLTGRRVVGVGRRGKFVLADLSGDLTWVIHLGMSGRVRIVAPGSEEDPHTHFVATLDRPFEVRLVDPRTFGFVAVLTPSEVAGSPLARLGRDALDDLPSAPELAALLAGRRAPIKALLLDQRLLAGLGNIYADEVLHRAGLHPLRPGGSLSASEVAALRRAVGPVLRAGIRHGGTSLDDRAYLLPDGRAGDYLPRLRVYGRAGEPCPRCGCPVERVVVSRRSAHLCPRCQPR